MDNTMQSDEPLTVTSSTGPYICTSIGYNSLWSVGASTVSASTTQPSLQVTGDADFSGDIKWHGRSLSTLFESIETRLAILTPNPEKLAKYEALRKAYDHYKLLEKLIGDE